MGIRLIGIALAFLFCGCIEDVHLGHYKEIKGWSDCHPEIAVAFNKMYEDKKISGDEYNELLEMNKKLTKFKEVQAIMGNIKVEQND